MPKERTKSGVTPGGRRYTSTVTGKDHQTSVTDGLLTYRKSKKDGKSADYIGPVKHGPKKIAKERRSSSTNPITGQVHIKKEGTTPTGKAYRTSIIKTKTKSTSESYIQSAIRYKGKTHYKISGSLGYQGQRGVNDLRPDQMGVNIHGIRTS